MGGVRPRADVGRPDGVTKCSWSPRAGGSSAPAYRRQRRRADRRVVHALEMGSVAEDVALTVHPHPTLSETVGFAAEVAEGTITDIYAPKRSKTR